MTADAPLAILHGPQASYPDGERIEHLIDLVATVQPDKIAVRWRDTELTYRELVDRADRVAVELVARGVAARDIVAVRAGRTPETVIALLGLLKAGAAYACAPMDWPAGRHRQLVEQTGAKLCLSSGPDEDLGAVMTVQIDELLAASKGGADQASVGRIDGSDPICVFLTSGTTGKPKAVLAPHRGVARTALDVQRLAVHDAVSLQMASMAWDVFALELWVTLVNAGTCVLFDEQYLTGPVLRRYVQEGVNVLAIPTPLFGAVVDDDPDAFAGLQVVFVGGERLTVGHARRFLRAHPDVALLNAYGPVENTINTTLCALDPVRFSNEVPIGTPVTNTSVFLLDDEHRVLPWEGTGELAVGGDGVALGYLGAETETARRFVTIDVAGKPVRVYLTGDFARIGDYGQLYFVGRRDRQLKMRGLRIESDEIERLIESVPGVTRGIVVPLPLDSPIHSSLAAFYLSPQVGVAPEVVRAAIAATVPPGFVPDIIQAVPSLPITGNGKTDPSAVAALINAGRTECDGQQDGEGGDDTFGEQVRQVATELLGYRVGLGDDLFDRGATSLTAIRLATRLSDRFARVVDVSGIFRERSPERIAAMLATAPPSSVVDASADDPGPETGYEPAALPPLFGSFWAAIRNGARLDEAVVPMTYKLYGQVDLQLLSHALDHLVADHEVLRVRFAADGDNLRVRVIPVGEAAGLLTVQPASATLDEAVARAKTWTMQSYDLQVGSPIRAGFFPAGDGEAVLSIGVHHIFFDGWSARLLSRQLAGVYQELLDGGTVLVERPPSYFRIVEEQRQQHQKRFPVAVLTRRKAMADAPELEFPLPADRPWSGPAAEIPLPITEALLAEVGRAAAVVRGTAMSVFFAAYVLVLRRYTGASSPAVAVPVSGRYTEQEGSLIGCMAQLLPLRLPAEAATPRDLAVAAAHELRMAMIPPLAPMGLVMPRLPEGYRRHPLLQAYLLQEEIPSASMRLGPARAELVRVPSSNAVPEISVELWPHPAVGGVLRYRLDAVPAEDAVMLVDLFVEQIGAVVRALTGR